MRDIPKIFFGWPSVVLHMTIPPVFFLAFAIVYNPFGIVEFLDMGRGLSAFNLSIIFAIALVSLMITRIGFHFFARAKHFPWLVYISWCLGEMLVISLFVALYVSLMSRGFYPYFEALFRFSLGDTMLILIYPYAILTLSYAISATSGETGDEAADNESLIRFYDVYKKPKLLIAVSAILYIKADENYMNIWYTDNGRPVKFSLRAPMNSIEESCIRHGLVRCQRSYFINPAHVTILRKENGWIYADLDMEGLPSIPVSKRYYDALSSLL